VECLEHFLFVSIVLAGVKRLVGENVFDYKSNSLLCSFSPAGFLASTKFSLQYAADAKSN
jgi:hypothetical protein